MINSFGNVVVNIDQTEYFTPDDKAQGRDNIAAAFSGDIVELNTTISTVSSEITTIIETASADLDDHINGVYDDLSDLIEGTSSTLNTKIDTVSSNLSGYVPWSATEMPLGYENTASMNGALAQGWNNYANNRAFAQGQQNYAKTYSFAQGHSAFAETYTFAQGDECSAVGHSLVQGSNNTASAKGFAQGWRISAIRESMAQGDNNEAIDRSFAQGSANYSKLNSFTQGQLNSAISASFSQGYRNDASNGSFAQGYDNSAYQGAFAHGVKNITESGVALGSANSSYGGFTQGFNNYAGGYCSFAQGARCVATNTAFAQGSNCSARVNAIAIGNDCFATCNSQAFGEGTYANAEGSNQASMAIGRYNKASGAGIAFVIGNGNNDGQRSDAFIVKRSGQTSAVDFITQNNVSLSSLKNVTVSAENTIVGNIIDGFYISAGDGVTVSATTAYGNTSGIYISAAGKTYTQGTGIQISNNNEISITANYVSAVSSTAGQVTPLNRMLRFSAVNVGVSASDNLLTISASQGKTYQGASGITIDSNNNIGVSANYVSASGSQSITIATAFSLPTTLDPGVYYLI